MRWWNGLLDKERETKFTRVFLPPRVTYEKRKTEREKEEIGGGEREEKERRNWWGSRRLLRPDQRSWPQLVSHPPRNVPPRCARFKGSVEESGSPPREMSSERARTIFRRANTVLFTYRVSSEEFPPRRLLRSNCRIFIAEWWTFSSVFWEVRVTYETSSLRSGFSRVFNIFLSFVSWIFVPKLFELMEFCSI